MSDLRDLWADVLRPAMTVLGVVVTVAVITALTWTCASSVAHGEETTSSVMLAPRTVPLLVARDGVAESFEPTPTPTPVTVVFAADRPLTRSEMEDLLAAAGFPAWSWESWLAVTWCESRWDPRAVGAVGELGLFQIRPELHAWRVDGDLADPLVNAMAALHLWEEQGWGPWTCA